MSWLVSGLRCAAPDFSAIVLQIVGSRVGNISAYMELVEDAKSRAPLQTCRITGFKGTIRNKCMHITLKLKK